MMPLAERLVRQQRADAADVESPDTHELCPRGAHHALNGGFPALSCARQIAAVGRMPLLTE